MALLYCISTQMATLEDFVTVPGVYFSGFDGTLERQRNGPVQVMLRNVT